MGIVKEEVIQIVSLLRDEKILADSKDLNAFIKKKDSKKNSLSILKTYEQIEKFLLTIISDEEKIIHLKELNEQAEASACEDVSPNKIKTILNLWTIKNWIKRQTTPHSKNHLAVLTLFDTETLTAKLEKRNDIAQFLKQIESMRHKNYVPKTAKIRFIVYWQKENTEREVRIVLPELYFEKILP
ncbi:hypothetical protein [Desulfosporosinus fructosivorans]